MKDCSSNRVDDFLLKSTIPIILHDNLLTHHDTCKVFELKGDLLKMITNKNYNVDLASLEDDNLIYDFAKEMHFDVRGQGRESSRDHTLIKVQKSPAIMASGTSNTTFLPSDLDELYDRLKFLLQQIEAGNNSDIINDKILALVDNFLEYK